MNLSLKKICVIVLGDIGRSPRMQYHSLSLSEHGHHVDIIGYGETQPHEHLKEQPLINYHYLPPYSSIPCPRVFNYIFKTIWQAITLFFVLLIIKTPDVIIVQNPPAVPSLLVSWFYSIIVKANLIIDWHNYAHTIMALSAGSNNPLVRITEKIECFVGRRAINFCVTNAMRHDLKEKWDINATTLYDKSAEIFKPISLNEKHEVLSRLSSKYKQLLPISLDGSTLFTKVEGSQVILKGNRPGILVSSTSWTEDEDFSILFQALQEYEDHIKFGNSRNLSNLICIITGKGPLKQYYCNRIEQSDWKNIKVITPWLESQDYPKILACADLGVSLHTSSSGLDLPMKIVDMFGCGLPVCAYNFNCLSELVQHGINSYTFKDSKELSKQLQQWFENFPNNDEQNKIYKHFQDDLKQFQNIRWRENWNQIILPFIK